MFFVPAASIQFLDGQPGQVVPGSGIGFGRHHGVRDFEPEPAVLHPEGKGEQRGLGFGLPSLRIRLMKSIRLRSS